MMVWAQARVPGEGTDHTDPSNRAQGSTPWRDAVVAVFEAL